MKKALIIGAGIYAAGYVISVCQFYQGQKKQLAANNDLINKPSLPHQLTRPDAIFWPIRLISIDI